MMKLPLTNPRSTSPAIIASSPLTVTMSACWAESREVPMVCSKPMSRYEVTPVRPQKTSTSSRSSASTSPSIEAMKASARAWKRSISGCAWR